MQGPQICAKPHHFCKLDTATSRMVFFNLNLHVLKLAISNSNNWGRSVVQNCTSDTPNVQSNINKMGYLYTIRYHKLRKKVFNWSEAHS